ncbi:MAG: glycosyltransferase [Jatrophihabitans endophyticus]|nr:glycosyltransferase [Jatrophihabitans endophyticus]
MTGAWVLPGNRWDLLDGVAAPPARVGVVVPYYDAQRKLDRTLAALARQTASRLEVVVADDGSPTAPDVSAAGDLPVRVVRQDDLGFRAAAARNLGAASVDADVLVFLDADTAPEPEFVARLTRLPALCPDAVTVGRRRHVDLTTDPPAELPEPEWLRDAYAASGDLLEADGRSYRFVISAVLAMSARLFHELGGFDERFVGYGGEDWELAHRAWVAGAVVAHVPDAVAWHDGPDWAGRAVASATGAKNDETLALATLLPDPVERGGGAWTPYPSIVVRAGRATDAQRLATTRTALAGGADVGVWTDDPPPDVLARARCVVDVLADGWVDLHDLPAMCAAAEVHGEVMSPAVRVRSTHALNRAARWWPDDPDTWAARLFGRHDRSAPAPGGPLDLAAVLRRC